MSDAEDDKQPIDRPPLGPVRIAVPAILVFVALVISVMWMRLSGEAITADRIAVLPNGPTLSESLRADWSAPRWSSSDRRVSQATASFRLGVLTLDFVTALRARDRNGAIEIVGRILEQLEAAPGVAELEPAIEAFGVARTALAGEESFAAAAAQARQGEAWLRQHLEPADLGAGLFVEQGRIILRSGKMPPRSWQRELDAYIASNSLSPQIGAHLEALRDTPTRSNKLRTLEILLGQLGDGRTTWLRHPPATI